MGGNGTYYLAFHHPERFAALAPICGWVGGNISLPNFFPEAGDDPYTGVAERIRGILAWIFHGEADFAVPVVESRLMYQEMNALGGPVTYTELPGTGHESWDPAYLSARFAEWLFQQRRP